MAIFQKSVIKKHLSNLDKAQVVRYARQNPNKKNAI